MYVISVVVVGPDLHKSCIGDIVNNEACTYRYTCIYLNILNLKEFYLVYFCKIRSCIDMYIISFILTFDSFLQSPLDSIPILYGLYRNLYRLLY
jgi:hypothetical protein